MTRLLLILVLLFAPLAAVGEVILPVTDFATTETARAAWHPSSYSLPVELFPGDATEPGTGVVFPVSFTDESRDYWDVSVDTDLSHESTIELRVYADDPAPVSSVTWYFHTPGGWYAHPFALEPGWQTVLLNKVAFGTEGDPAGWDEVDLIRFSPWRAKAGETRITLAQVRAFTPEIMLVTSPTDSVYVNVHRKILGDLGLYYGEIPQSALPGGLTGARIAILPYNSGLMDEETAALVAFVRGGGKVMAFYTLPGALATELGMVGTGYVQERMSEMVFVDGLVECLPERTLQSSWNYTGAVPNSPSTKVLAWWVDESGVLLGVPAMLLSPNGVYMSHVLLGDEYSKKLQMMAALLTHFEPGLATQITQTSLARSGMVGDYDTFDESLAGVRVEAGANHRTARVEPELAEAERLHALAEAAAASSPFCETYELAWEGHAHLLEAYYLAQAPKRGEFRAVWEHSGSGAFNDWEKTASDLQANGFNAIFPNMLWGGVAHYDSALLPHSDLFNTNGDQVAQAVAACHAHGIEVHVWKVNWNLSHAPQSFIDDMRAANRTQVDVYRNDQDWLCPSHPDNQKLELDTMLEVATKYDVDGIHFDYIRYPGRDYCYCDGCRARFQADTGLTVTDWPTQCYSGDLTAAYNLWRQQQITKLVRSVREAVDAEAPDVQISAAVFPQYPDCKTSVLQDWKVWVEEGYLDFLCPMNYTDSNSAFDALLENQLQTVNGHVPVVSGIGVSAVDSGLPPDQIIRQIQLTRENGTRGFILFNYSMGLSTETLPPLSKGITEPGKAMTMLSVR